MKCASLLATAAILLLMTADGSAKDTEVLAALKPMIQKVTQEFDQIPAERQSALKKTAHSSLSTVSWDQKGKF